MGAKTEDPTPRRLRKASEDGDSGASSALAAALGFLVAILWVESSLSEAARNATALLHQAFAVAARPDVEPAFDVAALAFALLGPVLPLLVAVAFTSSVVMLVQTGGSVAVKRIAPSFDRFDVFRGLGNLVSAPRLFIIVRSMVAALVVLWLATRMLANHAFEFARLAGRVALAPAFSATLVTRLARDAALVGLALGVLDLLVTRRFWFRRLRMSKDEVTREHKESEGDPQMKAARHRAHHEVLAAVMLDNVRKATVVVVNPTHLACALRYDSGDESEGAPTVVASGRGDLAARILAAASEAGVPIVRDVPLARALVELEVGESIPEVLYEAVAEVLRDAAEWGTPV